MAVPIMADSTRPVTGGVDTHRDTHTAAVLDDRGAQLGVAQFPTGSAGYAQLAAWMRSYGHLEQVGIEGTGSYGAGLARFLAAEGVTVIEVDRPDRRTRRKEGKSDPVDAVAAAYACFGKRGTAVPKTGVGNVEAIRALRVARVSARHQRIAALNQLRALIITAPDELRSRFQGLRISDLVQHSAGLRPGDPTSVQGATKLAMKTLGRRVRHLEDEAARLDAVLDELVAATAPDLLARPCVGTDTAGALLVAAGDNPERIRSEAAFARLCGVAPLEASSGLRARHRLNRGGNREANHALWRIAIVRLATHEPTQAYMQRRLAENTKIGKPDVIRVLKRYIAREVYHHLPR